MSVSPVCVKMERDRNRTRMTQVNVGKNEGIESALRRFRRQVSQSGIFADLKRLRHFETPLEKHKRKAIARRRQKRFRRQESNSAMG